MRHRQIETGTVLLFDEVLLNNMIISIGWPPIYCGPQFNRKTNNSRPINLVRPIFFFLVTTHLSVFNEWSYGPKGTLGDLGADAMDNSSADSHQICTPVSHTNGHSIRNTISLDFNHLACRVWPLRGDSRK